jgi:quinolinate synthase
MDASGREVDAIRREWGKKVVILGHYYQSASVLRHADEIGDSLELSRKAAAHTEAEKIVFCGVHFMAESADILKGTGQTVYMPETLAGCPMANMADIEEATLAWETLEAFGGGWLPVAYVNSSAEIKAFCGRLGGSTCTSSNAVRVFKWVRDQGKKVFFLPDEHLGRNCAADLGLPDRAVVLYDRFKESGGLAQRDIEQAEVIVWKGFCLVHTAFTAQQIRDVREQLPSAKIIVHPETPREVLRLADAHGSTAQIVRYVESAPEGSTVVIGTELNLVERLADLHRGRVTVKALAPSVCANMAKTSERNLLELLRSWPRDREVHVPEAVAQDARRALSTMLGL